MALTYPPVDINAKLPIIGIDSDNNIIDRDHLDLQNGEKLHQNGASGKTKFSKQKNNHNHTHQNNIPRYDPHKLNLPKPSFRKVNRAPYMKRQHTLKQYFNTKRNGESRDSYFHYEEPTADELNERVEYDMDLEDTMWLMNFNQEVGEPNNFPLNENDFEKVMDRLEKESYFESCKATRTDVDDDAECAICGDGQSIDLNAIIFCDMCDLAVHQECYGVPYVPLGSWLCKRCQFSPAQNVKCCLCPNRGGAFKQTDQSSNVCQKGKHKIEKGWAHVVCALWVPEVSFANTVFLEPIEGIETIDAQRWKLKCYICNQRYKGACIQCSKSNCYQSFHVTCAKQAGLYMKIKPEVYESQGEQFHDVKREVFCDKHAPQTEDGRRGGAMYSGDESDEDVESEQYKRKEAVRRKKIKKTRETLAKQDAELKKDAAIVKVDHEKLLNISKDIMVRGKKNPRSHDFKNTEQMRFMYVERIHAYWLYKRKARNGVPLLRRLQVSLNQRIDVKLDKDKDKDNFTSLRYDLEKARILMGEIKKRERLKRKALMIGLEIIRMKMDLHDRECLADGGDVQSGGASEANLRRRKPNPPAANQ